MEMRLDRCWIPNEWKGKVIVEDNLLPVTHFNTVNLYANSKEFLWNYIENVSFHPGRHDPKEDTSASPDDWRFGFTSVVFNNLIQNEQGQWILYQGPTKSTDSLSNDFVSFVISLLWCVKDYIGVDFVLKSRFDMTTRTPHEEHVQEPHVDYSSDHPHIACIIYMNDSDGDTLIYNETSKNLSEKDLDMLKIDDLTIKERIQPKKGRVVLFDGSFIHTGCSPHINKRRSLLNTQFTNMPKRRGNMDLVGAGW